MMGRPTVWRAPSMVVVSVEFPTATEDISLGFAFTAGEVIKMAAWLRGSSTPSVTWTMRHGTDRNATGTEVVTSGTTTTTTTTPQTITTFNNELILVDSAVWLETTAQSGTVLELFVAAHVIGLT